jgi:hypothetical protein
MSDPSPVAPSAWPRVAFYVCAPLLAIALPLWLAELRPPFVSMSYGVSYLPYELLGLTAGLAILAAAILELRRRRGGDAASRIAVVVPALLALHFVTLTSEYAQRRFDYDCYEYAGRALLAGESPYRAGLIYLYPPLTAQLFAAAHEGVAGLGEGLGADWDREAVWDRVFYLYQCTQVLLLLGAYFLLLRFGSQLGIASPWAPVLIGGLLLFDNAVFRTLRHGQVNLWVLDLSLAALVLGSWPSDCSRCSQCRPSTSSPSATTASRACWCCSRSRHRGAGELQAAGSPEPSWEWPASGASERRAR